MTATTVATPTLNYVLFFVADLDASHKFFTSLGFSPDPSQDSDGFRQLAASQNGLIIGLLQASDQTMPAGEVGLYFETPDLAALRETWTARGIAASPIVQMPFGNIFEVKTPDGRTLTPIG